MEGIFKEKNDDVIPWWKGHEQAMLSVNIKGDHYDHYRNHR